MYGRTKQLAARMATIGLLATLGLATWSPAAQADEVYPIAWTGIGIYPRTGPSMDASRASDAIGDGTPVTIACETEGQAVSNGSTTSTIWEQLSDGSFVPNSFVATGVDGWTPGIPRCGDQSGTPPAAQNDWAPNCGESLYFSEITVNRWANGDFQISATPSAFARIALDPRAATIEEWHAIQECVEGLHGTLADSIYDQLECHQHLAATPNGKGGFATGESYDLESWRPPFPSNHVVWGAVRCGNALNGDHTDAPTWSGRPDEGYLDLAEPDNIG